MTVAELREVLSKLPDNAEVFLEDAYLQERYEMCEEFVRYSEEYNTVTF
mgnify:CR=1 FL=1